MKVLRLRRADRCNKCGAELPMGERAGWDAAARTCTCLGCLANVQPLDRGDAGASALRVYERRADRHRRQQEQKVAEDQARRQQAKADHPILGRIASAIVAKETVQPEPAHIRSWATGAPGEKRVGQVLEAVYGALTELVLERRAVGLPPLLWVAVPPR